MVILHGVVSPERGPGRARLWEKGLQSWEFTDRKARARCATLGTPSAPAASCGGGTPVFLLRPCRAPATRSRPAPPSRAAPPPPRPPRLAPPTALTLRVLRGGARLDARRCWGVRCWGERARAAWSDQFDQFAPSQRGQPRHPPCAVLLPLDALGQKRRAGRRRGGRRRWDAGGRFRISPAFACLSTPDFAGLPRRGVGGGGGLLPGAARRCLMLSAEGLGLSVEC